MFLEGRLGPLGVSLGLVEAGGTRGSSKSKGSLRLDPLSRPATHRDTGINRERRCMRTERIKKSGSEHVLAKQQCHRLLASSTGKSSVPCSGAREEAAFLSVLGFLEEVLDSLCPEGCLLPERLPSEGGWSSSPSPSKSKSATAALDLSCFLPARRVPHRQLSLQQRAPRQKANQH